MILALLLACGPADAPPPSSPDPDDTAPVADTDPVPWRSALFPEGWTPAHTTPEGWFLHDVSYAGYHAGEQPLPDVLPGPEVRVDDLGADPSGALDSAAAIQAAIDGLVDGGVVRFGPGRYRVAARVVVRRAGVVVAGAGADATFVHFTQDAGQTGGAGLLFQGADPPDATAWALAEDGASRADRVRVADPSGLAVGDAVTVGWTITDDYVADHGMTGIWTAFLGQHRPFFRRTVVAVEGDVVVLDVPLRADARVRDGAALRRDDRYLTEVGLQDLAVSSVVDPARALAVDRHHAVELDRVADAWVRRVASFAPDGDGPHLQSGGLYVQRSRRVTVADVALGEVQHRGEGGNGYLFEVSRVSDVLVRDCVGDGGRHNFIQNWDFGTSGVVFLRTVSRNGRADNGLFTVTGTSEFHHSLAMANLIDASVTDDGWKAENRGRYSSGAGHAATETVFWNTSGQGTITSTQWGLGYVVGTAPTLTVVTDPSADLLGGGRGTEPVDVVEGLGVGAWLEPPSLYEAMLARRLGR